MTSANAIRVRGLRKTYGGTVAVDHLDLDVASGETVALLGPNGAGKTTTTEILEGFRDRDAGEVSVLGADPGAAADGWRARIGVVLQETRDLGELTVREIVEHFALYYPDPRDPAELIASVGLGGKRGARIKSLSGGQRRRLDVALGILGRPELLFLDEPTTGFDPEVRRQFWDLVAALRAEGTTILLTTHYLEEAERLADRVAVINHGTLLDVDSPARLGGRQVAPTMVRWTDVDGPHELHTTRPGQAVADLVTRFGGEVPDLTVSRPSLEDVYLQMIGAAR